MNKDALKILLENIRDGKIDVEAGISRLRNLSYIDLGHAKLDTHRELRIGYPEVIFCSGKTTEQIKTIVHILGDLCCCVREWTAEHHGDLCCPP